MAITLSLIAVFLPIAMMEGIVGRFLKSFGVTMAGTIVVSMLVSFTLTPMLAARWFKQAKEDDHDSPLPTNAGPRGAGGEGAGQAVGGPKNRRPHPNPLPRGEGTAQVAVLSQGERARRRARPAARKGRCSTAPLKASTWSRCGSHSGSVGWSWRSWSAAWPRCQCCSAWFPRTSSRTTTRRSSK